VRLRRKPLPRECVSSFRKWNNRARWHFRSSITCKHLAMEQHRFLRRSLVQVAARETNLQNSGQNSNHWELRRFTISQLYHLFLPLTDLLEESSAQTTPQFVHSLRMGWTRMVKFRSMSTSPSQKLCFFDLIEGKSLNGSRTISWSRPSR